MFRFSFAHFSEKEEEAQKFPLVTALNFADLGAKQEIITQPIICSSCGSVLIEKEDLKKQDSHYIYQCRFCLSNNQISKAEGDAFLGVISLAEPSITMTPSDLCFLLDQIKEEKQKESVNLPKSTVEFPIQTAIIDVSGSMSGGKLDAVKHALIQSIHELTANSPNTLFTLLPFSTDVLVYPIPDQSILVKDGPSFFKESEMQKLVAEILNKYKFLPLEKNHESWTNLIKTMHTLDMTALGPALFIGISLIIEDNQKKKLKLGGKVLLLTDGLANVGLGSIHENMDKEDKNRIFYHHTAELALNNNIVVDIVGVRDKNGSNSVALDTIGQVADYTGGKMAFITPEQVETAFAEFQKTPYIARNVILRVYVPSFIELEEIQGADVLGSIPTQSGVPIRLGAFYADREIYLKFKPPKKQLHHGEQIPVQIQLEYLDAENQRRIRLFRQNIDVVSDSQLFQKDFDAKVATAYELSKAADLRRKGDMDMAKAQMTMSKARNIGWQSISGNNSPELNELIDDEMDEWQTNEKEADNIVDKKSYYMAQEQTLRQSSYDKKMKRMMDKKK